MTSDKVFLDMVKGFHITFTHNQFPLQLRPPQSIKFTDWESTGAPNDRFRGNICSEPSRMAKIFGSPRTAKNFENVSW